MGAQVSSVDAVAIDCEMVGGGPRGNITLLARVSVVNENLQCIYDAYVKYPKGVVTDYRTPFSGIRERDLMYYGEDFDEVRLAVLRLIQGHLLVGHDLRPDLEALKIEGHNPFWRRDTALYPPFVMMQGHMPKLKFLARNILGIDIQTGEHCSKEDALACMRIYKAVKSDWEHARNTGVYVKPRLYSESSELPMAFCKIVLFLVGVMFLCAWMSEKKD